MLHVFELHVFFHSPKNVYLEALLYVLDLIDIDLEENFCGDSNLRVKLMYESVK